MAELAGGLVALVDISSLFQKVLLARRERTYEIFLDINNDFRHCLKRRTGQAQNSELRRHRPEDEKAGASTHICSQSFRSSATLSNAYTGREYDVEGAGMHRLERGFHDICHVCEQSISSPHGLRAPREVLEQAGVHTAVLICMRISSNFAIAQKMVDLPSNQTSWILHIVGPVLQSYRRPSADRSQPLPPQLEASLYIHSPSPMLFFAATIVWVALIHGHSQSSSAVRQLACLTVVVVSSVAVGQGLGLSTVASLLCISPWLLYSGLMIAMLVRRSTSTKDKLTSSAMKCSEKTALGRTTIAAPQKH
jgi:hypothetical protein